MNTLTSITKRASGLVEGYLDNDDEVASRAAGALVPSMRWGRNVGAIFKGAPGS